MNPTPSRPESRKIRVGVIFGGRSGEHEVSLASAASVLAAIDTARYDVIPMGITRDGHWLVGGDPLRALAEAAGVPLALPPGVPAPGPGSGQALARVATAGGLPAGAAANLDVMFPLVHGPYGEDGTLQGLLELADVPYVGAGVLASAVGMDKAAMKAVFRAHGLPVVPYLVVRDHEWSGGAGRLAAAGRRRARLSLLRQARQPRARASASRRSTARARPRRRRRDRLRPRPEDPRRARRRGRARSR